ncbi:protein containing Glycosyl transferase, group 1 domain protein [human gut metagenome]|uniref:Protein containing Glycosyl transferase, group 1 domain protein n=1 Tax=human gut metagenome TaxID=408170 RepID=K1SJM2_9ZZZZ
MKTVDVFVHPSIREGLGIAAIEAMSAGLPIITSNVQGIVDYSKNDLTGYCLDPNDVQGFTNALKTVINNKELRTKMGHYNIEASKKYDISNSCVQVESIINAILAKS